MTVQSINALSFTDENIIILRLQKLTF